MFDIKEDLLTIDLFFILSLPAPYKKYQINNTYFLIYLYIDKLPILSYYNTLTISHFHLLYLTPIYIYNIQLPPKLSSHTLLTARRTNRTRRYFQTMQPHSHKQAKQAPHRTESTSSSKRPLALKTAPHAPRRRIAILPARKRFKTRHNIVRRDCAKHDGWSYTITDRFPSLIIFI